MGREVKRVPLDFDWPMKEVWPGYAIGFLYYERFSDRDRETFARIVGVKDEHDVIPKIEVPEGEGWQMWENVTEGSPMSPVFKKPEELAEWLYSTGASAFGDETATYEQWLAMIKEGYAVSGAYVPGKGVMSGVALCSEKGESDGK